ncbi:MAG: threonine--tRNA ligase [Rhodococcus sp. (in: high G+C Gram-positive bacteria)]|nr:MAG: threonine--tRNA ligase [Rhodococcus sp. (in: high G+C Gram-positive bacteria)]
MSTPAPAAPAALVRVPAGTTAGTAVREAGYPSKGPDVVVVVRDLEGQLKDLSWVPDADVEVEPVAANTDDGRSVIRHSAAHVLAQAVQQEFPEAKLGIGPPIKDGFYYDFAVDRPFTPEDLANLEKRMKKIVKGSQRFSRRVVESLEDARAELAKEPFKLELINDKSGIDDPEIMEVGGNELTIYDNLDPRTGEKVWGDLCRGPHIPTTKHIPAFKLTRSSAAYWRGNQDNADLQRIYGTAWESAEAQEQHLELLAEAERRDHRKLGSELDLFSFPDELGSGLPVFHPKGGIIRTEMEDYSRKRHVEEGYEFVNTPHITKGHLYEVSGHLDWYRDGMFPAMHIDEELNEDGTVRKPGQDYYLKPMNCPTLAEVAEASGLNLVPDPGGAAFYGPKISVQVQDALGRTWQMSTIQLDFNLPERFDLEYTATDGTKQRPVMIHRALFGSIERFFGVLTEHYAGAFPAWLAPVQVVGIPVAEAFADHLFDVVKQLKAAGVRAEVDASDDRMQKKIFNNTAQKVPFMLLAGARDVEAGAVSFRFRDGTQVNGVAVDDAVRIVTEWIGRRENVSPTAELLQPGKEG